MSFTGFASRIRSRAAKSAKYENLWVFIRSDAHVVRAGLNIRGCGPLSTLGSFDRLRQTGLSPSVSLVKNSYEKQVLESNAKLTYYFVHIRLNVLNILVDLLADFIQTTGEFLHSADIGINLKQYILFVYILVKVQYKCL